MGILISNELLYTHSHKDKGQTVVHAHPYDKSEDKQQNERHSHTEAELFFFAHLNLLFPLFFLTINIIRNLKEHKQATVYNINYNPHTILPHNGRDPPLFQLIP